MNMLKRDPSFRYGGVLLKAENLINAERRTDYGNADESFENIAIMWTVYLGKKISAKDVAMCMALLKICRESAVEKEDNLIDAAGYIGLAADIK